MKLFRTTANFYGHEDENAWTKDEYTFPRDNLLIKRGNLFIFIGQSRLNHQAALCMKLHALQLFWMFAYGLGNWARHV